MKKVDKATIVASALFFVSIWVVLVAGITAVWLTVRVFGLVILPTGIVGSLLVVYFDWRAKLRRRMSKGDRYRTAASSFADPLAGSRIGFKNPSRFAIEP